MSRVNKYLFFNFLSTFASLFSTLFLIMSIVFFIQIARITSYVEINFSELIKLYSFTLPRILLFVVPIAYFVSLGLTLFRLSKENESIVIFTLGSSPNKMSGFFLKLSGILSAVLLFIAIVLIPTAAELNANFVDYKKTIAKLNLKGGQFGQKFSDWMVYISGESMDENNTIYENIVMYNPFNKEGRRLIIAKQARISNEKGVIQLSLNDGKSYEMRNDVYHVSLFESLKIRTQQNDKVKSVSTVLDYWGEAKKSEKRRKDLSTYILVALFPLASTLFAMSFGIVTYRYDKGIVYIGTFGVLFAYFALIMLIGARPFLAVPVVFFSFLFSGWWYYSRSILRKY
ncbi:MAG: LptF/LptG family permease [Campylobacter sp.]|nr:LptF/LptG family permease [Campylobacter sp.]